MDPNDRISRLPDNLIGHILSFLSTKEAVRTCTLSTHWKQQWASITHLDFDDHDVIGMDYPTSPSSFVNFVNRVLLVTGACIDIFRLRWSKLDYGVVRVRDWLSVALSRNVRQVDVKVRLDKRGSNQLDSLFSSRNLVVLKLGIGFLLRVPMAVSLDNLKILHFNGVEFEDNESFSKLISSCPALEELKLKEILSESMNTVNISSPSLKRLILKELSSFWFEDDDFRHFHEFVLNTPNLQYLEHKEFKYLPNGYMTGTLPCLDKARLNFELSNGYSDIDIIHPGLNSVANLYLAISNVRLLSLSGHLFECFNYCCGELHIQSPNFPRLTDLEIGYSDSYEHELSFLGDFLQTSPQLAALSFSVGQFKEVWDPPTAVPICMLYNLKVVKVNCVFGQELELTMVKYFLEKTNCLEELIISFEEERNEEFITEVKLLPRASKSCKLVFCSEVLTEVYEPVEGISISGDEEVTAEALLILSREDNQFAAIDN